MISFSNSERLLRHQPDAVKGAQSMCSIVLQPDVDSRIKALTKAAVFAGITGLPLKSVVGDEV